MADLFELVGRMRVEGADTVRSELASVSTQGEQTQSKLGGALGKVGGVVSAVGKVAVAGVAIGAAGIAKITKDAVAAYAEYEQLVGGVQKIFGDNAAAVIENGANAFKTAGMSANEYMQTVTSFSASLVQGLGGDTKAATEYADMAIRDMSDNANTYGTAIGDIQNAYNGFAKGNFTMLDNLKLGYGGTQAEMVRLMNDSGVLEEKITSMDGITFDQMIAAVHKVQENLKITGTTANEAEHTIEGSLNSTKAAWANLLTGMSDDTQDFNKLLDDFMTSAGHFIENITPRIKMIFDAIPEAIAKIAPQIPALLNAILPGLISGAVALVSGLIQALPQILAALKNAVLSGIQTIIDEIGKKAPQFAAPLQTAFDAIKTAANLLIDNFDKVVIAVGAAAAAFGAFKLLSFIGEAGSAAAAVGKMTAAIKLGTVAKVADKAETLALQALYAKDAVLMAASTAKTIALTAAQKAAAVAQKALNLVMNANPMGIIITVIATLVAAFITLWNTNEDFRNKVIEIWNAVKEAATKIFGAIGDFIKTVWEGIKSVAETVWNAIKTTVETVINAIKTVIETVFNAIKTYFTTVFDFYSNLFTTVWNAIKTTVTTVINEIKTVIETVWNAVKTFITTVLDGIKSTVTNVWNGIKSTITTVVNGIKSTVSSVFNSVKSTVSSVFNGIKSTATSVWNGIKTAITTPINAAKDAVKNAIDKIKSFFNITLKFPSIKMPHFHISGGEIPWGFGGKGSLPSVGVEWYAKGGIFDKATILPKSNGMIGVGEAGAEAVTPIDVLLGYVRTAVAEQNSGLREDINRTYDLLAQYLPQLANMQMVTDTGALVGQLAPQMDRKLGRIYENQGRGRA